VTDIDPSREPKKKDQALRTVVKTVAVTALVLTAFAFAFADARAAMGVFVGGALATANLVLFIRLGQAFLSQKGASAPWAILGFLKLIALFACVYLILKRGDVSALALVVGYGSLPIGIAVSSLFSSKDSP
jgi:lipopolysaccharide export LptBFGC system permease protein LptF